MPRIDVPYCSSCMRILTGDANQCNQCTAVFGSGFAPSKYIKMKREEKKMIVTIIGSYSKKEVMEECKAYWERFGHKVNCPCDSKRECMSLIEKQSEWIKAIKESDLVVAIHKDLYASADGKDSDYIVKFGESTSYEIAIALYFQKHVVFWG